MYKNCRTEKVHKTFLLQFNRLKDNRKFLFESSMELFVVGLVFHLVVSINILQCLIDFCDLSQRYGNTMINQTSISFSCDMTVIEFP